MNIDNLLDYLPPIIMSLTLLAAIILVIVSVINFDKDKAGK